MAANNIVTVREVLREEIPPVTQFVLEMIRRVYNYEADPSIHFKILNMEEHYINPEDCTFLAAYDANNEIAGTIGVCRYDGRIASLQGCYDTGNTAELARCYVAERCRRMGVGSMLVQEAQRFCISRGYGSIYLHTHGHLPGALEFWLAQGFKVRLKEGDEKQTIHMDKYIGSLSSSGCGSLG
ncbi:MAG: GNAT family N-acetyltransferase [Peptococcaceae bacterium]|nr:GNAT family N-acetyltransferase [Peptococcaceae bacterium]